MRSGFGKALRLGVATGGIALVKTSRWGGAPADLLAEHALGPGALDHADSVRAALAAVLEGHAGWPLTIVLADDLVRLWQVAPPANTTRLADLEAAAALRFQRLYGEPAAGWTIQAGWDPVRPFLAAALPRALLGALGQGAALQRLNAVEIVPQFVAVLNRFAGALRAGAWFGVVHGGVLTLGAVEAGGQAVGAVRAAAVPDGADAAWLAAHVGREALRMNVAAPQRLQLWGSVPPAWLEAGACTRLGAAAPGGWSAAALLAASGSAA
ncbi:hypothetical protein [Massilia sp. TWR1-2-2]|uniref:hypothetical protein n=1 Tax=Massilia sp. TWR1-2-2 TaxID=2804584 RepID=UPI003CEA3B10